MLTENDIRINLENIENRIKAACERAGRNRNEVELIAVSKNNPADCVRSAYNCGITTFGENRVQEMTGKMEVLEMPLNWHLIGHLQTNKVKYIIGKTKLIHSVDSVKLAKVISEESVKAGIVTDILLEVNVADEESKFGLKPEEVEAAAVEAAVLKGVHICGLMTVAPYTEDPEKSRPIFKQLKELSVDIGRKNIDNISMSVLSMGMTGDFEVAVEEGATHIRVGTGIFGARDYSI